MSAQTGNKAAVERFRDAVNTGDLDLIGMTIDELFAPDVRIRTPLPVDATGARAMKEVFRRLCRGFPDLRVTVEDLIAEGDRVASRNVVTGTHLGEYMGLEPTGRSVTWSEMFVLRFAGGRVAETWAVVDVLSQLRQLGAVPGAGRASTAAG